MGLINAFLRWRRAGEENAIRTYNYHNGWLLSFMLVFTGLLWLLFPKNYALVAVIALLSIPQMIVERRRAFILTPTEVIHRPTFGAPVRIAFKSITTIKQSSLPRTFAGRPTFASGLELVLAGAVTIRWRVDIAEGEEFLQRLRKATEIPFN